MPDTTAKLIYYVPPKDNSKPFISVSVDSVTGERNKNYGEETRSVVIEDLRGKEETASLDKTGFQYYKRAAKHTGFKDNEEIEREYYPESVELIKELTGASRVVLFDHSALYPSLAVHN